MGLLVILALIIGAITVFFMFFHNTFVYLKNTDEYSLIAKRCIKWNNPVVNICGLDVVGKEVAINVKKRIAAKLFGRHIKTLADNGFEVRCVVDKQGSDFWYVVKVDEKKHSEEE